MSRNPHFTELAKDAIVIHLLEYERKCKFRESTPIKDSDWYSYLYNYMISDLRTPVSFSKIGNNNFTFLTFNYDRSLEHFLTESISYTFENLDLQNLKMVMTEIPIIHIYGKIAEMPFHKKEQGLPLGAEITHEYLPKLRQNIRTIFDQNPNSNSLLNSISEEIEEAKRIFFLGFGFDSINLKNIGIPNYINPEQKIYGTALGLNPKFINDVKEYLISGNYNYKKKKGVKNPTRLNPDNLIFESVDSLTLLKNYL